VETELTADLHDVDGPGNCATGQYELRMILRVSVDDDTCIGGSCTWIDFPFVRAFTGPTPGGRYRIATVNLETVIDTLVPGTDFDDANYEILGVTVIAPDGLAMAAAGVGTHKAKIFYSNLGAAYPSCDVPNQTNNTGVPACGPIAWTHVCDMNAASVQWRDQGTAGTPELVPTLFDAAGSSPDCTAGAYQYESTLRMTIDDCGGGAVPCTLVDTPVILSATPVKNDIEGVTIPFAATGLTGPIGDFEVRRVRLLEPSSAPLLSTAVSNARRLSKPQVQIARKDLAVPNDDQIKIQGRMLRVPLSPPELDPNVPPGVSITVNDNDSTVYAVTIPNGAWEAAGSRSWRYKDKTGALNGVRKATIKLGASPDGVGYLVKLLAKDIDLSAATYPGVDVVMKAPQGGGTATAKGNRTCKVKPKTMVCK
jgi:hypothetical protein